MEKSYDVAVLSENKTMCEYTEQHASNTQLSTEKSKIMTYSTNNISADISMNGQKLEVVNFWEQPCARMASVQQKSASRLPQH